MCAVIDRGAFDDITGYIRYAKRSSDAEILAGGNCDDSDGYFIQPTVVETTDPHFKLMEEEIFGPVLTLYVYDDTDLAERPQAVRHHEPLRAHRRHLRPGPRGDR